jgi:hypothetical protein
MKVKPKKQKKLIWQSSRGSDPANVAITDNIITFNKDCFTTAGVLGASVYGSRRVWWEVSVFEVGGGLLYIGWAGKQFTSSDVVGAAKVVVGSCDNSYSYVVDYNNSYKLHNNTYQMYGYVVDYNNSYKLHNNTYQMYGTGLHRGVRHVIGVALDTVAGSILFSMDGDWRVPMGVAFAELGANCKLYPVISGGFGTSVSVNFGETDTAKWSTGSYI